MITKDIYRKKQLASKADDAVFNELYDFLEARADSCRNAAETLQNKGMESLTREEYESIIENLSKTVAYINIQTLLQKEHSQRSKEFMRMQKQYEYQLGKSLKK